MDEISPSNAALLRVLAGRLLPASLEFDAPGADDAAIFAQIEMELRPNLTLLRDLIGDLGQDGPDALAAQPLEALLARLGSAHGAAFGLIAMAAIQAYYRDDRVMRSLGLEPRPPFPKGHVVEEGDLALLDPVRARGRIWRDAGPAV